MELTGAFVLFLPLPSFEQRVSWTHGNCRPGQGAGALATGARCSRRAGRETGRYQSCKKEREKKDDVHCFLTAIHGQEDIVGIGELMKKERKKERTKERKFVS